MSPKIKSHHLEAMYTAGVTAATNGLRRVPAHCPTWTEVTEKMKFLIEDNDSGSIPLSYQWLKGYDVQYNKIIQEKYGI